MRTGSTSRSTVARWLAAACLALAAMGAQRAGAEIIEAEGAADLGMPRRVTASPLRSAAALPAVSAQPPPSEAAVLQGATYTLPSPPALHLQLLGTNDRLELVPFEHDGAPRHADMSRLATLFAPASVRASGDAPVVPDPRLVELLLNISKELDDRPIVIVSGHRKPGRGTSHKSFHVRGMAADISVVGVKPRDVRKAAIAAGALGIGLYPGYVHVDAREEKYHWSGGGGRRRH